jgi:CRISPR system Cascade subunit CasD
MPALSFYLDAPMQSWGASSKYQYRETNSFPTKSAIIGIIAAAMGIDKHAADESTKLAPLTELLLTVVKIGKTSSRLTDFHTIGGGYDKSASLREKMSIPQKASGAPFGTVITRRSYLTDAAFIAILEGDSAILEEASAALLNPKWGVWFGRKNCLPATPLTPTIAGNRSTALAEILEAIPGLEPLTLDSCEYQEEHPIPADGVFYQSDQPVAYGQHHGPIPAAYRARPIRQHRP